MNARFSWTKACMAACSAATCATLPAQAQIVASIELNGITAHRLADTNGDGRQELLFVQSQDDGTYRLLRAVFDTDNPGLVLNGRIDLVDPAHTLISIADMLPPVGDDVLVATPRRTACLSWSHGEQEAAPPVVLARRARFTIRVDRPRLSQFVIDLNKDGLLDLMLPTLRGVQPFIQEKVKGDGVPRFRRMAMVDVPVETSVSAGSGGIDQEMTGSITVPQIDAEDLNGDGRPDLLTREGKVRAFHMQRTDGTFAEPITIDIAQFEDSTPKAVLDLGTTAVLSDSQLMQRGDINGDGIPDYVIAHRRKIWTFLGNSNGPQFRKARTQAVADDVTAMLLMDIDGDEHADLLTFRVQLPSIGALVLGLVQSIDVDVRAVAYASEGDGFAKKPKWRRTVTVRIPPLLSLLSHQDELIERFLNLINKARVSARGEFLVAGQQDLALVAEDSSSIELFTNVQPAPHLDTREGSQMMRRLLFEDEDTIFDLDRVFGLISGFLDKLSASTVGDRQASASLQLRNRERWYLTSLRVGEFDGQPGEELLAIYRSPDDESVRAYDVLSWR